MQVEIFASIDNCIVDNSANQFCYLYDNKHATQVHCVLRRRCAQMRHVIYLFKIFI